MTPSTLFGRQWIAKLATLVVIVAGAATVAVANLPQPADHTVPGLPAKNVSAWSMPLDRYLIVDDRAQNYAEFLLQAKCMSADGVTIDVPWQDPRTLADFAGSDLGGLGAGAVVTPLSEARAAAVGYHDGVIDARSDALWGHFVATLNYTPAQSRVADSCLRRVRRTQLSITPLEGAAQNASQRAVTLANRALRDARQDPAVVAHEQAWRSCMASAHVADLPDSPALMPSPSVSAAFSTGTPTERVSAGEKALAEQDARCMTSSGYRKALYDAEYQRQEHVTAADLATLTASHVDQPAYAAKVARIIAENLPAKPVVPAN